MMSLPVYQHARVERALEAGYEWWARHHSPDQATRWFNGFIAALHELGDNPRQWPIAAENDLFPIEIRQMNYGLGNKPTHRAIFTVRPNMVYVLFVRHLAQEPVTPDHL